MAQALIVIDMQKALKDLDERTQVLETINKRIDQYRQLNKPIVFIQHTEPGMEVGGDGWQLFDELNNIGTDTYFNKTKPDSFYQTGLESYLKMNDLKEIEICGAQVEFCVDTTIRVAFHLGFKIDILIDGITTMDSELLTAKQIKQHHAHIWENRFGEFVSTAMEV
jgi:Amidases related to nicotinamidase